MLALLCGTIIGAGLAIMYQVFIGYERHKGNSIASRQLMMQQQFLLAFEAESAGLPFRIDPEIWQLIIRPSDLVKVSRCKQFQCWCVRVLVGGWTLLKRGFAFVFDPKTYRLG